MCLLLWHPVFLHFASVGDNVKCIVVTRVCVCLSVCLSVRGCMPTLLYVIWGSGRGCPLVVHYWADLQSVHGLCCYGNARNAQQSPVVIHQARRTHCACTHAPVIKSMHLLHAQRYLQPTKPFHFVYTAGVL